MDTSSRPDNCLAFILLIMHCVPTSERYLLPSSLRSVLGFPPVTTLRQIRFVEGGHGRVTVNDSGFFIEHSQRAGQLQCVDDMLQLRTVLCLPGLPTDLVQLHVRLVG